MDFGDVNEVKNFYSLRALSVWCGYSNRAQPITDKLMKNPPLICSKLSGYTYKITILTPEQKNVLKMEPYKETKASKLFLHILFFIFYNN